MNIIGLLRFVLSHPLNATHRTAALGRVLRWQLASRLIEGPLALPFVDDTQLFVKRGMTGATGNWYCGLHELPEMAFVLHALRSDDLFVDVGANIGSFTVLAAGAVGADVIAVEPVPSTFESLCRNVRLNGLDRCEALQIGLSDLVGALRFTSGLDTVNHVLADGESAPYVEVPVVTMDEMLKGRVPRILKIDVEGHELAVLRGAAATLASKDLLAVILETNGSGERYGIDDDQIVAWMSSAGFGRMSYEPFLRQLLPWNTSELNSIFVRDVELVLERVKASRRFRLVNASI